MKNIQHTSLFGISGVPGLLIGKDSKKYFSMDTFKSVLKENGYEIDYEEIFYWPYEMPLKFPPRMPFATEVYYFAIKNPRSDYAEKILSEYIKRINALAKKSDKIFIFAHSAGTIFTQRLLLDKRLNLGKCEVYPVLVAVPNQMLYGSKIINKFCGAACREDEVENIKYKTVMITGKCDPLSGPYIPGCDQNTYIKYLGPLNVRRIWEYIPGFQHGNLMTEDYKNIYKESVDFYYL